MVRFSYEQTTNGNIYLDMLANFASQKLQDLQRNLIFQQGSTLPHWKLFDMQLLENAFPLRLQLIGLRLSNKLASPVPGLDTEIFLSGALLRTKFIRQKSPMFKNKVRFISATSIMKCDKEYGLS